MKGCQALLLVFSAPVDELFQDRNICHAVLDPGARLEAGAHLANRRKNKRWLWRPGRTIGAAVSNLFHFY